MNSLLLADIIKKGYTALLFLLNSQVKIPSKQGRRLSLLSRTSSEPIGHIFSAVLTDFMRHEGLSQDLIYLKEWGDLRVDRSIFEELCRRLFDLGRDQ